PLAHPGPPARAHLPVRVVRTGGVPFAVRGRRRWLPPLAVRSRRAPARCRRAAAADPGTSALPVSRTDQPSDSLLRGVLRARWLPRRRSRSTAARRRLLRGLRFSRPVPVGQRRRDRGLRPAGHPRGGRGRRGGGGRRTAPARLGGVRRGCRGVRHGRRVAASGVHARESGRAGDVPGPRRPARLRRAGLRRAAGGAGLLAHLLHAGAGGGVAPTDPALPPGALGPLRPPFAAGLAAWPSAPRLGAAFAVMAVLVMAGALRLPPADISTEFSRRVEVTAATISEEASGLRGLIGTDPGKGAVALVEIGRGPDGAAERVHNENMHLTLL